jgi:hypothetical protein
MPFADVNKMYMLKYISHYANTKSSDISFIVSVAIINLILTICSNISQGSNSRGSIFLQNDTYKFRPYWNPEHRHRQLEHRESCNVVYTLCRNATIFIRLCITTNQLLKHSV